VSRLIGRPAGLRRLRPGRPAHRRDQQAPVLGRVARRDREGAPRPVQHLAPGHGPRDPDDNNGRKSDFRNVILIMSSNAGSREMAAGSIGFSGGFGDLFSGSKDGKKASSACSPPSSATGSTPPCSSARCRSRSSARSRASSSTSSMASSPKEGAARGQPRRPRLVRRARLRQGDGRAPHGPPRPIDAQGTARQRDPVRQADQWWHRRVELKNGQIDIVCEPAPEPTDVSDEIANAIKPKKKAPAPAN